ncbi:zinc-binding dehydrogenase [Pseudalkalibacillus sp. A8]|uniref:zinc-dependent alcohol dehydrogenase n=1 Tax=Pseudalkalibacillus sp. A8 TaxID=3382641 RepID=UPI0038B52615
MKALSNVMVAAVYHGKGDLTIENIAPPEPPKGWATIKVDYCGICGTDLNIYGGGHPRAKGPLVMGHEFSGETVNHPELPDGTRVTVRPILSCGKCEACQSGYPHVCESLRLIGIDRDGAMAQYVVAPLDEITPLPEGMSTRKGSLVEPFAVGVHAIRESEFKPGDQVVVFGAGPIGICTAVSLQLLGARDVVVVEVHPYRQQVAEQLGFTVINPQEDSVSGKVKELFGGSLADIVFDCAAHPSVAEIIVDVAKVKGQIVLVGTYKKPTPLDLQNITFKELSVKGTRVYTKTDYNIALDLLKRDFDFEKIITHEVDLKEVQKGIQNLIKGSAIKVLVSLKSKPKGEIQ